MLFSSSVFIFLFLPCVLFLYYTMLRKTRLGQNVLLTFASLFFYAWGEPLFVLVMLGSIFGNWAFALWVDRVREKKRRARAVLSLMLCMNLGVMFIFKYLTFVLQNLGNVFGGIPVPNILLPIGISFFTFQAISYVVDVYRRHGEVQKNPLNVALYIAFFPQLIAGPIVRYETVAEQIKHRTETFDDFSAGCCRFIVGLGKKMILANNLAVVADRAFAAEAPSVAFAWLGALAYTFQIFYDFSGYSDMAIGLGKMFGFHFLENFDYPYVSKSISEFWRRWHISLGSWFRDYVYFPLGGSRVDTKLRLGFNLFVVWFLTGVWHGANWTFVLWGLMYFVLIAAEKLTGFEKRLGPFGHAYTLFFVIAGWVLFRANSIGAAWIYLTNMAGLGGNALIDNAAVLYFMENRFYFLFAIMFSIPIAKGINRKWGNTRLLSAVYPVAVFILFLVSTSFIVKGAYNPFIYFNF